MKEKFSEFYRYSDAEIKKIWKECLFVFDTNVLLDLYRYSNGTSKKYIDILKKINVENRIWIPHQVGLEFHKRRIIQISDLKNSYFEIKSLLETAVKDVQKKIEDKYHKEHPFLDLKNINVELDSCLKKIVDTISKNEEKHPDWFNKDDILVELNKLFKENVGEEYSKEKLNEIYKKGAERYANCTPPGYEDAATKKDERKYGDLILWFQIIDKAKEIKKPIIFVTRDKKEDWWWKQSGNTIGPRYELKKEIADEAKVDFHMYDSERFLEYAFEYYNQTVDKKILQEVKRIKSLEERNYLMHKYDRARELRSPYLNEFLHQQQILSEEMLQFFKDFDLDEVFVFEFNDIQGRILRLIESASEDDKINPVVFDELLMLQYRMQRRIIDLIEGKKLSSEQIHKLERFFEKMNSSNIMFMKFFDRDGSSERYYHRMEMNNHRFRRAIRDLE